MSSNYIYQETIPYFYIIRHISSGKMYAGARWAKGCNPEEFMQPNGYKTSSTTIHKIIEKEGLNSFEILRIDTNLDGVHSQQYETLFLQTLNCAKSLNWINSHNNNNIFSHIGTEKFYDFMIEKYGVKNCMQSPIIQEKVKLYYLTNFGVENPLQIPEIREKHKKTCFIKYGVEFPQQCPEIILKSNATKSNKSQEEKNKFYKLCSDVKSKNWKIIKPDETEILIKNLKHFCIENKISYNQAKESNRLNSPATHKSCFGWKFIKLD